MRINFKHVLIFTFIGFIFSQVLHAQIYEKLNGPYGGGAKVYEGKSGNLFQFYYDTDDNLVIYRSVNGGSYWNRMPNSPMKTSYDPIVVGLDGNLYGALNDKIYTSVNNGQSWGTIKSPNTNPIRTVQALPNGVLLIAQEDKVYQSSNNGLNWVSFPLINMDRFFYNKYTNQVYAINFNKLYISNDFGITWGLLFEDTFGFEKEKELEVSSNGFIYIGAQAYFWKLDTNGTLILRTEFTSGASSIVDIALEPNGTLYASKNLLSYYSLNNGDTWSKIPPTGSVQNNFYTISAISSGSVFGHKLTGSLYQSDNLSNWYFSAHGMNYASILEIEFFSETKLLVLTHDGLFYSDDSGLNWSFVISSQSQAISPKTDRIVLIGSDFFFKDLDKLLYFKDVKSQAIQVKINGTQTLVNKLFFNPKTRTLFSMEGAFLYRSLDLGKNWELNTLSDVEDLYSFADGSMVVITKDGIKRSGDNGNSWNFIMPLTHYNTSRIIGNGFSNAYIYFFDKAWKLIQSIDRGITWELISIQDPNAIIIEPATGQACNNIDQLFVGSLTGEIYRSADFGNSFQVYLDGIHSFTNLDLSPLQKLYLLTHEDGLYRTKISTSSNRILTGNVFSDENKNCTKEAGESNLKKRIITASKGSQNVFSYSDANGDFRLPIEQGDYTIQVPSNNNTWKSCVKTVVSSTYNFADTLYLGLQINSLCPFMELDIQAPILRRCFDSDIYVYYSNTGTQVAKDAYIDIQLDSLFEFVGSTKPITSQIGNSYRFNLGDVAEGFSGFFKITIKVSCNARLGQLHCVEAHIYPDTSCLNSANAHIQTTANCLGDSTQLIIRNIGNASMISAKKYSIIDQSNSSSNIQAFETGVFFLTAGQEFIKVIPSRARVLFIAEQDDAYPYNKLSSTEIISCAQNPVPGAAGFRISNLDEEEPYISKFCQANRGSFDPNDITGYPLGITDKKYIDVSQDIEYIIRFQNTGTDTAFNIRIKNELPIKQLDLTSLILGASSHPYSVTIDPLGTLIFSFSNILLPDSSIHEKASHGFIQYRIQPLSKIANGTKILNNANIFFDFNDAVKTNTDFHTIGVPIPVRSTELNNTHPFDFDISPNPITGVSKVKILGTTLNETFILKCMDLNYREIWTKTFTGNQTTIEKSNLNPGVYLLEMMNLKGETMQIRKLIVE
ncbi:MAG: hypothetical protein WAR77_04880 [Saprospiraceae bacterium]